MEEAREGKRRKKRRRRRPNWRVEVNHGVSTFCGGHTNSLCWPQSRANGNTKPESEKKERPGPATKIGRDFFSVESSPVVQHRNCCRQVVNKSVQVGSRKRRPSWQPRSGQGRPQVVTRESSSCSECKAEEQQQQQQKSHLRQPNGSVSSLMSPPALPGSFQLDMTSSNNGPKSSSFSPAMAVLRMSENGSHYHSESTLNIVQHQQQQQQLQRQLPSTKQLLVATQSGHKVQDPSSVHRVENRLTRISLCIVWLFIFCHAWKLIPTIYEGLQQSEETAKWPKWLSVINDVSHTLIVFNSAVNFLIYAML